MIVDRHTLTTQQFDALELTRRLGGLTRTRGGYVAQPGGKRIHQRTIMALQRYGFLKVSENTQRVEVTGVGTQLLLQGFVDVQDAAP